MQQLLKAIRAISDETRLRILNVLMERECCVCEVIQALEISQTRASRNLNILYDAGYLDMKKDGLWSLYSIKPEEKLPGFLYGLIKAVKKGLESNEIAARDISRLKNAERIGPSCAERKIRA